MILHAAVLLVGKGAGVRKESMRQEDHADVVQQAGQHRFHQPIPPVRIMTQNMADDLGHDQAMGGREASRFSRRACDEPERPVLQALLDQFFRHLLESLQRQVLCSSQGLEQLCQAI